MKAIILDQAYNELYDAVEYYEGEQNGLAGKGARLNKETKKSVKNR